MVTVPDLREYRIVAEDSPVGVLRIHQSDAGKVFEFTQTKRVDIQIEPSGKAPVIIIFIQGYTFRGHFVDFVIGNAYRDSDTDEIFPEDMLISKTDVILKQAGRSERQDGPCFGIFRFGIGIHRVEHRIDGTAIFKNNIFHIPSLEMKERKIGLVGKSVNDITGSNLRDDDRNPLSA